MSFYSIESNAQNIQSVTITSPISCYGDLANINIQINQSTPPVLYKVIVGYYPIPGLFVSVASTNNTTVTNINVPGLAAQNYTIRLVDSLSYYPTDAFGNPADPNSIIDVATINITQPLQLSNSASVSSSILCFGDCDATATVNVMGGTPPYSIAFGSGASTTISLFDSTYIDLCAGTYSISVTDANSCIVNISSPTSIIINEPPQLIPNGSITSDYNGEDISCFGIADGEITANVSGGTPPYTYSLDGITYGSTLVFSSLSAGTYTIYYKDDNGCDTSESVTLNNPPDLSGVVSISSQVSCFGVCDGELTFQVNNILTGTAPYTYSIGGGPFQNSPTFPNLCGNTTYSITVMDANGCIYNANKFLPEPTQISFTYSTSDYNGFNISCFGLSDGEIIFNAPSGGQPPYTYSIDGSNFNTTMNFTGLSVGTYPVKVPV